MCFPKKHRRRFPPEALLATWNMGQNGTQFFLLVPPSQNLQALVPGLPTTLRSTPTGSRPPPHALEPSPSHLIAVDEGQSLGMCAFERGFI